MPSKLFKVLSLTIVILLILVQVDQSIALGGLQNRSLSPSKLKTEGPNLNPPYLQSLNETDLETEYWEQIFPPQSPIARVYHGMAYDNNLNAMVLFGGDPKFNNWIHLDDTWEYDGSNWNEVSPELSPQARTNITNAMVYDQAREKIVLFGGLTQTGRYSDTWEYYREGDIRIWEPITTTITKPLLLEDFELIRDSHAMAYDTNRQRTIMFGGWSPIEQNIDKVQVGNYLQDTWEYDGVNWQFIETQDRPKARHQHALAYDIQRGVVVLFGGRDTITSTLNDTWEYDGINWYQVPTTISPSPRSYHSMAYDPNRKVVVLYGGQSADGKTFFSDTWEYDGSNWVQISTGSSPDGRHGTPLAYDNQWRKMILFGGAVKNGNLHTSDETWEYTVRVNDNSIYLPMITK